jgi:exopolyphosphatase/guanosine-5'-triphosphate,3'-diphosphate pyrophosphatase
MRIAAIDIGTNSIHMVIARAVHRTEFVVLDREREVVQVGRGSFVSGRLRRDAIRRTSEALRRFVQLARRHQVDRILCTATAAVREARNGGEFLKAAREASGVGPRVIPAAEEGRLIYFAVKAALQLDERPSLLVDIGGGSVQLVVADRERLHRALSLPLGALRLTETMLEHDPPTEREIARLRRLIRRRVREGFRTLETRRFARLYGSSGAIHALAHVASWEERGEGVRQINGHEFSLESIERQCARLLRMNEAQRERLPGLDALRAEIIVPGALVLSEVLRAAGAESLTLSDYGVREGLVTDYLLRHAREVTALEPIEDLRLRSVLGLLARFEGDGPHPRHVAKLALRLFEGLREWHGLGDSERDLLQYSALLHDIGAVVGYDGHAEHSAYIIRNGNLRGLHADEVGQVALVARYHGKGRPRRGRDPEYAALDRPTRRTVRWLAAILRVAEGLDRSHYQLVRDVSVHRRGERFALVAAASRDAQLELWAARRRVDSLSLLLGAEVRIGAATPAEGARAGGEAVSASRRAPAREDGARVPSSAPAAPARPAARERPGPASGPSRPRGRHGAPVAAAAGARPRGRAPRPAPAARHAGRETAPAPAPGARPRVIPLRTATS